MKNNRTLNLQLFAAEAVKGNKIVYLYRILEEAATTDAVTLAFATEDELSISKDYDSTVTKDGSILTAGEEEIEKSSTTLLAVGDTMYDKLRLAMKNNKVIEIWELTFDGGDCCHYHELSTKENYIKACEVAKKLFLGEDV